MTPVRPKTNHFEPGVRRETAPFVPRRVSARVEEAQRSPDWTFKPAFVWSPYD